MTQTEPKISAAGDARKLYGTLKWTSSNNIEELFDMLGLNRIERKIIIATASQPVKISKIMEITGESRHTVKVATANLERRKLIERSKSFRQDNFAHFVATKTPHWTSDMRKVTTKMRLLASSASTNL